ncbi:MAG: PfkB family carbohydrate kinase, partial [Acidobacteriota bacterium]
DSVGKWIVEDLRREGLDTSGVLFRKGFRSPTSVILVEGGRRTICEPWQTDLPLTLDELHARGVRVEHCRYLLLDARLPELQTEAARRVRSAGGRVVLDCGHPRPGVDEILRLTDIAILSQSYPRAVHGDGYEPGEFLSNLMDRLPKDGPRIVGLTLGSAGCVVRTPETALLSIPGHPVEALDSTGAGDVFHGAFIHALLSGESPESAARFANAAAALKCLGLTGRFPLPPEKEIRQLARI